jgi:serine/threonine-protein kinase
MGTVFLATHEASGREVALKTINTRLADEGDFVTRFAREAKALASIRHPSVAEILGSGEAEGHCWLAMEFIDGPSLMAMLKEHKVLPEGYALGLVRQVAEGMAHVWDSAKMVHRDIKPENILVLRASDSDQLFSAGDVAKIIDFGLVKTSQEDDRLTQTGMTIGTPLYMSPEQVLRPKAVDAKTDIWSLGVVLYEALAGVSPHEDIETAGALMVAICGTPAADLATVAPHVSARTAAIVRRALAIDPAIRHASAEDLLADLRNELPEGTALYESQISLRPESLRADSQPTAPLELAETAVATWSAGHRRGERTQRSAGVDRKKG